MWQFIDSLESKDFNYVLKEANVLFKDKNNIESFFSLFLWKRRLSLLVESLYKQGLSNKQIIDSILEIKKNKKEGLKLNCSYHLEDVSAFSYYPCKLAVDNKGGISEEELEFSISNILDLIYIVRGNDELSFSILCMFFMVECGKLDKETFKMIIKNMRASC